VADAWWHTHTLLAHVAAAHTHTQLHAHTPADTHTAALLRCCWHRRASHGSASGAARMAATNSAPSWPSSSCSFLARNCCTSGGWVRWGPSTTFGATQMACCWATTGRRTPWASRCGGAWSARCSATSRVPRQLGGSGRDADSSSSDEEEEEPGPIKARTRSDSAATKAAKAATKARSTTAAPPAGASGAAREEGGGAASSAEQAELEADLAAGVGRGTDGCCSGGCQRQRQCSAAGAPAAAAGEVICSSGGRQRQRRSACGSGAAGEVICSSGVPPAASHVRAPGS
jgi:hypothetical protein